MKPNNQDHLVHLYLLGGLPEEEQLSLERDYFTEPEMFERVWEIEIQLVDQYVRGELNRDEKKLFEQNYLASPVHRKRVTFAKALLKTIDSGAKEVRPSRVTASQIPWWSTLLASLRGKYWQWATIAAAVLLTGITIVLFSARARLHRQIDQLRAEASSQQQRTQELEKEIATRRDQSDKLADEIARLQDEPRNGESSSQPSQSAVRSVLSVVLSPMLMRSEGDAQQIKLTNETSAVFLQMRVKRPEARDYQVDLRTVEGVKVWSSSSVKARLTRDRSTVSVSIPASRLATSEYILTLSATNDANQTEEINRCFFRISK